MRFLLEQKTNTNDAEKQIKNKTGNTKKPNSSDKKSTTGKVDVKKKQTVRTNQPKQNTVKNTKKHYSARKRYNNKNNSNSEKHEQKLTKFPFKKVSVLVPLYNEE